MLKISWFDDFAGLSSNGNMRLVKSEVMKVRILTLFTLLIVASALGRAMTKFISWVEVQEHSPAIIIAHCGDPTPSTPGVIIVNGTLSDSAIEVACVLKGTNTPSQARLLTDHELQKGENYLVFCYFDGNVCEADEEYRVIPLGVHFHTNSISGKPLDAQLKILFQRRLDILKRQQQREEEEQQRLEALLK